MGFETNRRICYDWHNKPETKYGFRFKSQIERKWADYLQILKDLGAIISWEYEPKRFSCGHKFGKDRYYTPDFKIVEGEHGIEYEYFEEIKTTLRQKDISRFKWLKQSFPELIIVLVLPYCANNSKQALLRQQAHKYVQRIVYANPLFKQYGIK